MGGIYGISQVQTGAISAIQTIMQLITSASVPIKIKEFGVSFNGTSNTATPIDFEVLLQTSAGTSSGGTVSKIDSLSGSLATTNLITFSGTEPTSSTLFHRFFIHPQTGFVYVAQPGAELKIAVSSRVGFKLATAPASVNVNFYVIWEE